MPPSSGSSSGARSCATQMHTGPTAAAANVSRQRRGQRRCPPCVDENVRRRTAAVALKPGSMPRVQALYMVHTAPHRAAVHRKHAPRRIVSIVAVEALYPYHTVVICTSACARSQPHFAQYTQQPVQPARIPHHCLYLHRAPNASGDIVHFGHDATPPPHLKPPMTPQPGVLCACCTRLHASRGRKAMSLPSACHKSLLVICNAHTKWWAKSKAPPQTYTATDPAAYPPPCIRRPLPHCSRIGCATAVQKPLPTKTVQLRL